jgi:hypothetical protein
VLLALVATTGAFLAYFCMYAFRKPVSAATYQGVPLTIDVLGRALDAKTVFMVAQIVGYCVSKFFGTVFCTAVRREHLARTLTAAVGVSWMAMLLFAVVPPAWKVAAIFINGLPLGVIWGLIVRYLEGRRISELLLAGLSCSYILSSGETKRAGRWLVELGVPELWMPFVAGALFLPLFALGVGMLSVLPGPDEEDERLRSRRVEMTSGQRWDFIRRFLPGLLLLFAACFFLTSYREFRDIYQVDLFLEIGTGDAAAFSRTERPVAFGVLAVLALLSLIKDNRKGLAATYGMMLFGVASMGVSMWAFDHGMIGGEAWMIATGLGVYLAYVPFGGMLFERIIATTRFAGTAVFAIYLVDALGYTGAVGIQIYRDVFAADESRLEFFRQLTYVVSIGGVPVILAAMVYFLTRKPENVPRVPEPGGQGS